MTVSKILRQEELNHQIQQSNQVMKMANNLVRSVAMSTLGGGTLLLVVGGGSLVSCRRAAPLPELNTLGDKCLMKRIFFLSPAHCGGKRAVMLTRPGATFELARQVRIGAASLGEVFAFCSGLYFRGKLAYARHFAQPPEGIPGVQIITPSRGLVAAETLIGKYELSEFARIPVDTREPRFTGPLKQSIQTMSAFGVSEIILLGSVATGKYTDTLLPLLGERLLFPSDFAGRGDMSRGALLLRSVAANEELHYVPVGLAGPTR